MREISLSPGARQDLAEIWDYTVRTWEQRQAETYFRSIDTVFQLIAGNPVVGVSIEDIRPGYRKFPILSHMIYYKVTPSAIEVVRILHKRMDVGRHL